MSEFSFVTLVLCVFMIVCYFLWSRRQFYKVAWQLPGPWGLPFLGVGLNMMNPETFLKFMERMSNCYKSPFISWMGTKCFLYVNDPETMQMVFNSPHCTNKGDFYRFIASAFGNGLFTSSSPRWNKHRRLINPAFNRQIIDDFLPIFNNEANDLLQLFASEGRLRKLEIYSMLKKSVLEIACQTTMGKKMNFHSDGSSAIFAAYNDFTEVCVRRMLSPWLYPNMFYRLSPLYRRQQKVTDVLNNFVKNLLQRDNKIMKINASEGTEAEVEEEPEVVAQEGVILKTKTAKRTNNTKAAKTEAQKFNGVGDVGESKIGKSRGIFVEQVGEYVAQGQLSWKDIRDEANTVIAATFETTSTALYLVCLCLAMHPDCQDKLYDELVQLFPETVNNTTIKNDHTLPKQQQQRQQHNRSNQHSIIDNMPAVTQDQLERMTYTEMVINEAMRLFAPVPIVLRSVSADMRLLDDTIVPKGTQIGLDIFNMQRSEHVWGTRAQLFDPEHFNGEELQRRHAFAFVPFTRGLRMCIGYRYALILMKVLIAKIFRNFRIETNARIEDLIIKGTISLKLREYPLCTVIPRLK